MSASVASATSTTSATKKPASTASAASARETKCSYCSEIGHYARTCEAAKNDPVYSYKGQYCALLLECSVLLLDRAYKGQVEYNTSFTIYLSKKEDMIFQKYLMNKLNGSNIRTQTEDIQIEDHQRVFFNKKTYDKLSKFNENMLASNCTNVYDEFIALLNAEFDAHKKAERKARATAAKKAPKAPAIVALAQQQEEDEEYETAASDVEVEEEDNGEESGSEYEEEKATVAKK